MKIKNNNLIYFNANFINNINIGKLKVSQYEQIKSSFVKIDTNNEGDISALENISKFWKDDSYAQNIYNHAKAQNNGDIYVLTLQTDTFEKLDDNKILGITEVTKYPPTEGYIDYIQIKPNYTYDIIPEYKGVGSAILSSLKKLYNKITLLASNCKSVKDFYKRNEFIEYPKDSNYHFWYRDIFNS